MKILLLFVVFAFMFVVPTILGMIWLDRKGLQPMGEKIVYSHLMGFFTMLALWQLITVPLMIIKVRYRIICVVYMVSLCAVYIFLMLKQLRRYRKETKDLWGRIKQSILIPFINEHKIKRFIKDIDFYQAMFGVLLMVQLYFAFFYSRTYMSDDGYAVYSAMALEDDFILMTRSATGIATYFSTEWVNRALQTELYFPGFISWLSGIDAASICHTVFYGYVTVAGYCAYYLLSLHLFEKKESKWLFLDLLSLLYIFGYHSHYSLTFRMLGPNDEGKAILAVVMTPLMLYFIGRVLREGYSAEIGKCLMMLSLAGMSLTLGGAYTFAALLGAMIILGFIIQKDPKLFLLGLWGGGFPAFYASIYLLMLLS